MTFNLVPVKQAQEVILLRKTNKIFHPTCYFNNAPVKLLHTRKQLGLQLDSKLSLNENNNNKINKVIKDIVLLQSWNLFYHVKTF